MHLPVWLGFRQGQLSGRSAEDDAVAAIVVQGSLLFLGPSAHVPQETYCHSAWMPWQRQTAVVGGPTSQVISPD